MNNLHKRRLEGVVPPELVDIPGGMVISQNPYIAEMLSFTDEAWSELGREFQKSGGTKGPRGGKG